MKKNLLTILVAIWVLMLQAQFVESEMATKTSSNNSQSRDWSIVATYEIPGKASGLAFDGTYLYSGIYGSDGDKVYRIDPSDGSYELYFSSPELEDAYGLTYDGANLWTIHQPSGSSNPALATKLDASGNFLDQIALPDHYMSGIAFDNDNFWVCTYYPDPGNIYKIDAAGTLLGTLPVPNSQIWDICTEGENLWVVEYNEHMIYKIDAGGVIIESHSAENIKPSGIVYDGQYLWYVDGQLSSPSTLYKVDLGGIGTPAINISVTEHDYGNVILNQPIAWMCQIQNTGNADLIIEELEFGSNTLSSYYNLPVTIEPGNSIDLDIVYTPVSAEPLDATVNVLSTDPVNPEVELTVSGHGVYADPYIEIMSTNYDYGERRVNSYSRWWIEIKNMGSQPLILEGIDSPDDAFMIDEGHQFPFLIETLNTATFGLWFNPLNETSYASLVTVNSNDPVSPNSAIDVFGDGIDPNYVMGDLLWSYQIDVSWDNSPKAILSIPDITGDGIDDVIVCSEDDYIRCFNGNASVTADAIWEREIYSGAVYTQNSLDIMPDINNDGYWEVIVGTTGGDRSIYALSGKTGEIHWKHETNEYGDGGWVYQVDCSYDYNNDSFLDVLAATGDDSGDIGPKRVYCLDALTGNSIWENANDGPVFSTIGVEDFTGDGIPDALGGASNSNETQGKIIGINGSNGATSWIYSVGGSSVWALAQVSDINGDNVKDIIAGDFSGHYYILNAVYGSNMYDATIGPYLILRFVKIGDLNGNGHDDIIFAHSGSNAITIDGYTGENIWLSSMPDKSWNVAAIDDISGDGINDVIVGTLFSNNYCEFLDGVSGDELHSVATGTPVDAINTIPDITGDMSMEVVVGGRNGMVYCYSGGLNTGVGVKNNVIRDENKLSCFPNPFEEINMLSFELANDASVVVDVYDADGSLVTNLFNGGLTRGVHNIQWNGTNASGKVKPGVYFYQVNINDTPYRTKVIHY